MTCLPNIRCLLQASRRPNGLSFVACMRDRRKIQNDVTMPLPILMQPLSYYHLRLPEFTTCHLLAVLV